MEFKNLIEQIKSVQSEIVNRANTNLSSLEMREWEILNEAHNGLVKLSLFLRGEEVE